MGTRILVIDDEEFIREDIQETLEDAGYIVDLAEDGESAWALLQQQSTGYSTIILDRMMPNMSGMALLAMIKADYQLQHLPVILQTAKVSKEDIIEGLNAGAYYYLPKPYELEQLLAIVKAAIIKNNEYQYLHHQLSSVDEALGSLTLIKTGNLECQLRTRKEAIAISTVLSHICPNPQNAEVMLFELLVNAIEHGNLGFTYQEKTDLLDVENWYEVVQQRLEMEEYRTKVVKLRVSISSDEVQFRIEDEGAGFDWKPYLDFSTRERILDNHGRGIAICNHDTGFSIQYLEKGNIVVATLPLE
ncbi:MAG: response regulator [SAR324 cluster bacterium]|nr:response regulator [SAR324 cluster bacterium]